MGRLDGKTVLVIGGAQGIGEGCALAAASEGADLVIGDVDVDGAVSTADEARSRGGRAVGLAVDVVQRDQVDAMVVTALDQFGAIHGLVNVAFLNTGTAPMAEMSLETFQRQLQVDVVGCLLAMQAVHPHLRERGGSIVNFSSGAGVEGLRERAGYTATKAAIRLLSRTAALEWGGDGVRVNTVCPLSTSPSVEAAIADGTLDRAEVEGRNPLGRLGDPETDIGAAVAFLLSDDARYVTGQTIAVDGGTLAHC